MPASRLRLLRYMCFLAALITVTGCQPDHSPLKEENEHLRDQLAKQEAIVSSIQDGSKFLQEQTTLLTQEAREAKKEAVRLEAERQATAAKLQAQLLENRKLTKDNQLISATKSQGEQSFRVDEKGGQSEDVPHPLAAVCKAAEETLVKNGYTMRVGVKTDQKAVYVTDRKLSSPSSLELSGFRNQYLVSIQTLPSNHARISIKADFEKMGQGGRVLVAGNEEIAEIERRLIGEIRQALAVPGKV